MKMLENVFLVSDSGKHKKWLGWEKEKAESQVERHFIWHQARPLEYTDLAALSPIPYAPKSPHTSLEEKITWGKISLHSQTGRKVITETMRDSTEGVGRLHCVQVSRQEESMWESSQTVLQLLSCRYITSTLLFALYSLGQLALELCCVFLLPLIWVYS